MKKTKLLLKFKTLFPTFILSTVPVLLLSGCSSSTETHRFPLNLPISEKDNPVASIAEDYHLTAGELFAKMLKNDGFDTAYKKILLIIGQQELKNWFTNTLDYSKDDASKLVKKIIVNLLVEKGFEKYTAALNEPNGEIAKKMKEANSFSNELYHWKGKPKYNYQGDAAQKAGLTKFDKYYKNYNELKMNQETINEIENDIFILIKSDILDITGSLLEEALGSKSYWETDANQTKLPVLAPQDDYYEYEAKINSFKLLKTLENLPYIIENFIDEIGETIITMAHILNNMFEKSTTTTGKLYLKLKTNKYTNQLQDTNPGETWYSKFTMVFNKKNVKSNDDIDRKPNTPPLTLNDNLTPDGQFFKNLQNNDKSVVNAIDPIFSMPGYVLDNDRKSSANEAISSSKVNRITQQKPDWIMHNGTKKWTQNNKFDYQAFELPVFFIDVINNFNWNYLLNLNDDNFKLENNKIIAVDTNLLLDNWLTDKKRNVAASNNFSKMIRNGDTAYKYDSFDFNKKIAVVATENKEAALKPYTNAMLQKRKWKLLFNMLMSMASKNSSTNSGVSKNIEEAIKEIGKKYIKEEDIANSEIYAKLKSFFS